MKLAYQIFVNAPDETEAPFMRIMQIFMAWLIQYGIKNQLFYQTYFKLGYDNQYKIIAYDTDLARTHFQNKFVEYHMEFFKAGITQTIKLWLKNGCKERPEDLFEIIKSEYKGRDAFFSHADTE